MTTQATIQSLKTAFATDPAKLRGVSILEELLATGAKHSAGHVEVINERLAADNLAGAFEQVMRFAKDLVCTDDRAAEIMAKYAPADQIAKMRADYAAQVAKVKASAQAAGRLA